MIYLGIDPGLQGGIAFLSFQPTLAKQILLEVYPMPLIGSKDYDVGGMKRIIKKYSVTSALIEKQQAMPGQGLSSTLKTGMGFGILIGLLTALEIPYQITPPQKWQNSLFAGLPIKQDTKVKSAVIARRLFPGVDFRKSDRSKKPADGMTDAACIAEYCRRSWTGEADKEINENECPAGNHLALQENPDVCIKCGAILK